jgi:subtilisin family serine protease
MNACHLIPLAACLAALSTPPGALANAEGPGTPQATAANATFLSNTPAPATGGGICVIDSGVDTDTDLGPALAGRTSSLGGGGSTDPADFGATSDTGDALPKHGTYVAGIIASQVDGKGTSGIWPTAKIYSARVFAGGTASAQVRDYINAVDWCQGRAGVKVINLSLSGLAGATNAERANLDDKIAEVRAAPFNVNVVAAAGNNGSTATVGYPASSAGVFAVGASDNAGTLASFSNRGAGLDIAAFGVDACVTTNHDTSLALASGTSHAAPVVSAVLAAVRSYDPSLTPTQAEALLLDNADIVGGIKVLNAAKAFRADAAIAAMAGGAPVTGLGAAVANVCEAPPIPSAAGGGGTAPRPTKAVATPDKVPTGDEPGVVASMPVPAPIVDVQFPSADINHALKPSRPTLRSVSVRRGVLTVRIAGRTRGERALFRVDGQRFVRDSSTLKVRLKARKWKTIRVQLQRVGAGISPPLVIRAPREF